MMETLRDEWEIPENRGHNLSNGKNIRVQRTKSNVR